MTGAENVLINDWCQQFPWHSIGRCCSAPTAPSTPSAGDGASFTIIDYGQLGGTLSGTPTRSTPAATRRAGR